MMKQLCLLVIVLLLGSAASAQTRQLTGTVKDAKSGAPLPAVTVQIKGKNLATVTGSDGSFTLKAPVGAFTLQLSLVGYGTKTMEVSASETNLDLLMDETSSELGEVVVTALGISRESKKVGYAVTKVDGAVMTQARETNIAYSLTGRVAGLNVSSTSGGPASSARILLRGMASFNASSPLFVINGVPMDNTQRGAAGEWGGSDNGDGIANLNPDDIESMTVLKGAAASALYGSRATNGVIIITTKGGKKGGLQVEYNMNYAVDKAIDFTDYQYVYGQGQLGVRPANANAALNSTRLSWGEKLDGAQTIQFDGKEYAYTAYKDNVEKFYRTGPTFTNTAAVSGGNENGAFRLSLSNMDNKSIVRNSGVDRKTVNLNLSQKANKLKIDVMANYIDEQSKNRPQLSDGPNNSNNIAFLANNVNQALLAPGYDPVTGKEVTFTDDIYVTNPWFVINQYHNDLSRKRLITSITARYDLTDWIYAQARVGYDQINDRQWQIEAWGTAYQWKTDAVSGNPLSGTINLRTRASSDLNADGLIGIKHDITKDLNFNLALGASAWKRREENVNISGTDFIIPYFYSYNNVKSYNRENTLYRKEQHSAYYSLDLAYKNYLTLTTTGRYDTYSTLPSSNRGIFIPSVAGSFIFSELLHSTKLSYGKLRASYARASGEPSDYYITQQYYSVDNTINGTSYGSFTGDLPNLFLKPFTMTEVEVGTELKFFDNRLGFDIAYFTRKTNNEILKGDQSWSTGWNRVYIGTGSTQNKGVEMMVSGTPVTSKNFSWNVSVNATHIKNKILDIYGPGNSNTTFTLGTYRPLNANTALVKGMAGPQVMAYDYLRNDKGEIVLSDDGLPQRGKLTPSGSVLPTWFGGINNDFSYKNFNLSVLVDGKFGNKMLSATEHYSIYRGLNKMTLAGREGGVTAPGVKADGSANTTAVEAQTYYQALANNISVQDVLDASFIKLRQVTLGYTIGSNILGKTPFQSIGISLVARNLLVLMKHTDNVDPEAGFSPLINYAGIEGTSLPSTRTYGINVNVKFKK
ncbi:MAG TPA: SusC/RagA family TonB-linked outer membrane protein [Chitinophaga sp.]|uniref:SusC/RagA family TonB-linked outer membrane protein n=1 Tax=Chitinophaga sp. TaxID=1869181 RepID=UPI002DB6DDEC|nr:SusC/RagA family TonB-linked outer membrane protein [Chitinophaga sp.]HEU4551681.1 SusC/RagA family TonB-linked outer membrane protein [Chitinophaga sp.]